MKEKYANFRHAKIVKVLKVEVDEGEGTAEDAVRRVIYYLEPSTGKIIFKQNEDFDRLYAGTYETFPII